MNEKNYLNDPDYRWYHKEEMSKIMPFASERKRLGVKVIDYNKMRSKYLSKIEPCSKHNLNWVRFRDLVVRVPKNYDNLKKKSVFAASDMLHFEKRDKCKCYLCGSISKYTHLHHVIPNGGITDDNIVTLCKPCHKMVHLALYSSGRWKYVGDKR